MKRKTLAKSSIFPAPKEEIFTRLRELGTLQYIAAPFASFFPLNESLEQIWREGEDFAFHLKLFGFLPLGIHTIHIVDFDETTYQIFTNECNKHVPVWNHHILLESTTTGETRYTDKVEIYAGWKTPVVYVWAKCFYKHRQKKWRKLLGK